MINQQIYVTTKRRAISNLNSVIPMVYLSNWYKCCYAMNMFLELLLLFWHNYILRYDNLLFAAYNGLRVIYTQLKNGSWILKMMHKVIYIYENTCIVFNNFVWIFQELIYYKCIKTKNKLRRFMHLRLSLENRVLYSIPDLLLKTQFVYSPSQLQLLKIWP